MKINHSARLKAIIDATMEAFPRLEELQVLYGKDFMFGSATRYGARLTLYGETYGFEFIIEDFLGSCIDEFTMRLQGNIENLKNIVRSKSPKEAHEG